VTDQICYQRAGNQNSLTRARLWTSSLQRTILTASHIPHPLISNHDLGSASTRTADQTAEGGGGVGGGGGGGVGGGVDGGGGGGVCGGGGGGGCGGSGGGGGGGSGLGVGGVGDGCGVGGVGVVLGGLQLGTSPSQMSTSPSFGRYVIFNISFDIYRERGLGLTG